VNTKRRSLRSKPISKRPGFKWAGVESHPVAAEKIKFGVDGRDEEIENYIAAIKALGNICVPVLCYNFMAGLSWYRTRVDAPGRGGALITDFDNTAAKEQGLTKWGDVPEEKR
jgi:mannonate dehydratase